MGVVAMNPRKNTIGLEVETITPEMANKLLEANASNRPISQPHVNRIADQIRKGQWKFNGDTIKVAEDNNILDGQHRLWAVIEAQRPIESIIVRGLKPDAFSTIDTIRRARSGADVLSLQGIKRYRGAHAAALTWLIRYKRGVLQTFQQPENRVENSDIEKAAKEHYALADAVDATGCVRLIANHATIAFVYYAIAERNYELASEMLNILRDPSKVSLDHPFFRLRAYFTSVVAGQRRDALMSIALAFKAANAADKGQKIKSLTWRNQGAKPEPFPTLDVEWKRS